MTGLIIAAVVIALLGILIFALGYFKAPPDTAYIISGLGKRRISIGKAGWRMPFLTRLDKLSLGVMQVDVKTSEAVPTNEFINVTVDGVANIKISSDPTLLERAAESLLGKTDRRRNGNRNSLVRGAVKHSSLITNLLKIRLCVKFAKLCYLIACFDLARINKIRNLSTAFCSKITELKYAGTL